MQISRYRRSPEDATSWSGLNQTLGEATRHGTTFPAAAFAADLHAREYLARAVSYRLVRC